MPGCVRFQYKCEPDGFSPVRWRRARVLKANRHSSLQMRRTDVALMRVLVFGLVGELQRVLPLERGPFAFHRAALQTLSFRLGGIGEVGVESQLKGEVGRLLREVRHV